MTSLSMDPPSILVCVNASASVWPVIEATGRFNLTLLAPDHGPVVDTFCHAPSGPGRFAAGDWSDEGPRGMILAGAAANLSCRVDGLTLYGTHVIVLGRVEDVVLGPEGPAMVYRDGAYAPFG